MRKALAQTVRRAASRPPTAKCCREQHDPVRSMHSSSRVAATALPINVTGPPPHPPVPAPSAYGERIDRRRRQAEMIRQSQEIRASQNAGRTSPLKKRFWTDVHVKQTPEGYNIYLDSRPVRTPNKTILTVPLSKPHLAHAVAIEWDMLVSAQQALKNHNIPITSIVSRAQDLIESESRGDHKPRDDIITMMMRYLETDTILCWAPDRSLHDPTSTAVDMERTLTDSSRPTSDDADSKPPPTSLRQLQQSTALPIIQYLVSHVWPGTEIHPVLPSDSILPTPQPETTTAIIRGWLSGLPAYELAGLERAVLAGKSLLIGTRLLVEWSEHFRDIQEVAAAANRVPTTSSSEALHSSPFQEDRFGIEEASEAASLEVSWQTRMWGEVEDTHDVDREDIRRQFGAAVLLISGV